MNGNLFFAYVAHLSEFYIFNFSFSQILDLIILDKRKHIHLFKKRLQTHLNIHGQGITKSDFSWQRPGI